MYRCPLLNIVLSNRTPFIRSSDTRIQLLPADLCHHLCGLTYMHTINLFCLFCLDVISLVSFFGSLVFLNSKYSFLTETLRVKGFMFGVILIWCIRLNIRANNNARIAKEWQFICMLHVARRVQRFCYVILSCWI